MNSRSTPRYARDRSPSPKTHRVLRTTRRLRDVKGTKGPSPTSVMAHSFDFDEEPFDCRKRASSVGNLSRMNCTNSDTVTGLRSSSAGKIRDERVQDQLRHQLRQNASASSSAYPQQHLHARVPPTSTSYSQQLREPGRSPSRRTQMPSIPKSPRRPSSNGPSFRQRRLLLAQTRKWKGEMMEKTVQSKTTSRKADSDLNTSIISGKAKVVNSADGLEISILSHLEKEGFDRSLSTSMIENKRRNQREFPVQSANMATDDRSCGTHRSNRSNRSNAGSEYGDPELDAMTIDTVSSLNTMQSEFSVRSWYPPNLRSPNSRSKQQRKINASQNKSADYSYMSMQDSLHPPMYVQSKSKVRMNKEPVQVQVELPEIDEPNTHTNKPSELSVAHDICKLEITEVVSNKTTLINPPPNMIRRKKLNDSSAFDKENDIPAIQTSAGKYDRASMISNMINSGRKNEGGASISDDMSATALRRRRLQKSYLSKQNRAKVEEIDITPSSKDTAEPTSDLVENMKDQESSPNEIAVVVKAPNLPRSSLKISPFDESEEKSIDRNDDNKPTWCDDNEEKMDSDLHTLADKRDFEEDEQSIMTSGSIQTYSTLKTCFTKMPSSQEEMEAAIKKKRNRIYLFHHALTCTHPHPEKADDEFYVPCPEVKHCHALGVLVRHVQTCTSIDPITGKACEVPGCAQYRKVWNHYRRCVLRTFTKPNTKKCKICGDVWRKYVFDIDNSFENSAIEPDSQKVRTEL